MKIGWIIIAFVAGAFLPIQAGLNARMGKVLDSPVFAAMISFIVGALAVLAYIGVTREHASWSGLRSAPGYVWLAGALGGFYVTAIILAFPRIGPALTFGVVVAGQMVIAIALDHFNILVAEHHPINLWRIVGVVLVIGGVIIIRKF